MLTTFRAPQIAGTVRLGTPDDYAFAYLPPILKRFAETHPAVQVDVVCSPSHELMHRLKARRARPDADLQRPPAAGLGRRCRCGAARWSG